MILEETIKFRPFAPANKKLYMNDFAVPQTQRLFVGPIECARHRCKNMSESLSILQLPDTDVVLGNTETLVLDAVKELYEKSNGSMCGVMLHTGCQTRFIGVDFEGLIKKIESEFPLSVAHFEQSDYVVTEKTSHTKGSFAKCAFRMLPEKKTTNDAGILILSGSPIFSKQNELYMHFVQNEVTDFLVAGDWKNFEGFLRCGRAFIQLVMVPEMLPVAEMLHRRQQIPYLYIPLSYRLEEIVKGYAVLDEAMGRKTDLQKWYENAKSKIDLALDKVGGRDIVLQLEAPARPWNLVRALLEYGFKVSCVSISGGNPEQKAANVQAGDDDWHWIKRNHPSIQIIDDEPEKGGFGKLGHGRPEGRHGEGRQKTLHQGRGRDFTGRGREENERSFWGFAALENMMQRICMAEYDKFDQERSRML